MSVPLVFLEPAGNQRMAKTIGSDGTTPYPLLKKFTSHVTYLAPGEAGLREAFTVMQSHANKGHALHKGVLKQPLLKESRRGQADANAPTQLLVIDIDDHIPASPLQAPISQSQLADLASLIRSKLPAPLNTTACIANASASTGHKPSGAVGLHLFFLLDRPVSPGQMTHWLTSLNFAIDIFQDQLKLNRSNMSIKWQIDPVVARNSQIIYIAPPVMQGIDDSFESPDARWVMHDGEQWSLDLQPLLDVVGPAKVQQDCESLRNDLRRCIGGNKQAPRFR